MGERARKDLGRAMRPGIRQLLLQLAALAMRESRGALPSLVVEEPVRTSSVIEKQYLLRERGRNARRAGQTAPFPY